jgi:hypothetical protein
MNNEMTLRSFIQSKKPNFIFPIVEFENYNRLILITRDDCVLEGLKRIEDFVLKMENVNEKAIIYAINELYIRLLRIYHLRKFKLVGGSREILNEYEIEFIRLLKFFLSVK